MLLTTQQEDILTELINIGMGRAASTLNQMMGTHVLLQVPVIEVMSQAELIQAFQQDDSLATVRMNFKGTFAGAALLVFPRDSASIVVDLLMGQAPQVDDLDMLRVGALTEVGNIILNGVVGSLSNMLQQEINYTIPTYLESDIKHLVAEETNGNSIIIMARTQLKMEQHQVEGHVILLFQVDILDALIQTLDTLSPE
jgi:chemotaxis protein CheC